MIRRSAGATRPSGPSFRKSSAPAGRSSKKSSGEKGTSSLTLLIIAALLTAATFLFPKKELVQIEQEAEELAQKAEKDLMQWMNPSTGGRPATPTSSKWVDGEKKLKLKLKELVKRQEKGLDIGVPVLTRYLGEDIPAWPDETISKEEWTAKVKAKYEEMAKEEEEWKAQISRMLDPSKSG